MSVDTDDFQAEQREGNKQFSMLGAFSLYSIGAMSGAFWTMVVFWLL